MNSNRLAANLDDPSAIARLSASLAFWDPAFELYRPDPHALLYEPDGTLFAVAVGSSMKATCNHRERDVHAGDLMVVPVAMAVEVEPLVDLLGLRFTGPAPDHFREKFLQRQGFDLFPSLSDGSTIADGDPRFPISSSVVSTEGRSLGWDASSPFHRRLLATIDGAWHVESDDDSGEAVVLPPRSVLLANGDEPLVLRGAGRLVRLQLEPVVAFLARRRRIQDGAS